MVEASAAKRREENLRAWSRILSLWHLCGNAACTRARACRGNIRECGPPTFALLPENVRDWFCLLGLAQNEGLTFEEALRKIEATSVGSAFEDWCESVAAVHGALTRERRHG